MPFCPGSWPVDYTACASTGPEDCWTDAAKAQYEAIAGEYLWRWTGQQFGLCPVEVRPCATPCAPGSGDGFSYGPVLLAGQWYNLACGRCGDICSCGGAAPLRLPFVVESVTAVTIDGAVVPPASYRIDNGTLLVRTDGSAWPRCQAMHLDAGEVGTWSVELQVGVPVPAGGQLAAGVLAVELAKAACGDATCQLPRRVQTITRQGVTVALLDAFDDVGKGRTGVWLIDSWVASVTGPARGGSVRSVDVPHPRHRVTTWPAPVPPVP